MSITKKYYKDNSKEFFDSTVSADVSLLYEHFLKYIPANGSILDLGCGSGRDTKAFLDLGYRVEAIDGSKELCEMASKYTGITVKCLDFSDIPYNDKYDAVWACASLLHVSLNSLGAVITKVRESLHSNGVLYMSFKYGDFEGERDGRFFNDMTEDKFGKLLRMLKGWLIVDEWKSEDVRREKNVEWYNVILRKECCER